ncbi:class I SAM-dependent methyltransferase [Candidatus Berkiella aquae]|uniref:Class I SAM-dependent methyltransferase n=1 Tax=Candidatus Berkiella aquae TaxID=295108 RepID=A0A0Q9YW45_9GAMM|nr:class I SAM-dependent methyltransferase [Candidatus Berkiella aquae]MCS5710370.1 class I SAM-dependent methyltransferase [Candidatus Berkiella aquae]
MKNTKPSQTAVWIAKGLLYLNLTGKLVGADDKSIALWRDCVNLAEPSWLSCLKYPWYRYYFSLLEYFTIPGLFKHYAARKQIIDRWTKNSLENQCEQVIVLAAGFDALTQQYYSRYPDVLFVEIDHPATQEVKKKAFMAGNAAAANVQFVSADLAKQTLLSVLSAHVNPSKKTLFIVEGLTMYFHEPIVKNIFSDLQQFFQNDLHVIFTFMEQRENGSIQFANASFMVDVWLKMQNETFRWGIAPNLLEKQFLEPLGYHQLQLLDPATDIAPPKTQGEWLCLARVKHD